MKRLEYYISVAVVIIALCWTSYVLYGITSMELDKTNEKISLMETQIKVLESKTQRDTIIINLNLKKDGI